MTATDYKLMDFFQNTVAKRPQRKFEETITYFDREMYLYDKDPSIKENNKTTIDFSQVHYEDHRKAIEAAVSILHKRTPREIAMAILTHRFFKNYRNKVFPKTSKFYDNYTFLLQKINTMFNTSTQTLHKTNISAKLTAFKTPTLVQINHATGTVTPVNVPKNKFTLNEWAQKFNFGAPASTTYGVYGLSI